MKKSETRTVVTETVDTYYCDFCEKRLGYNNFPKDELLGDFKQTSIRGSCYISAGWNYGDLNDLGGARPEYNSQEYKAADAEIKEFANRTFPIFRYDCCYDCFSEKLKPFLESQKIKPTV
mgnify:CR=1 FL=1